MNNGLFKLRKITTGMISLTCLVTSFVPLECNAISLPMEQLAEGIAAFSFSQQGILPLAATVNCQPSLEGYLEALTVTIRESKDPLASTKRFLSVFLGCANASQNSSLDMQGVYDQLREKADMVPIEYRDALYAGVYALEANRIPSIDEMNSYSQQAASFYWPWQWSWFGLNKQSGQGRVKPFFCKVPYGEYFVFALIAVSLTYIALHNPGALPATFDVLKQAALFCGVI